MCCSKKYLLFDTNEVFFDASESLSFTQMRLSRILFILLATSWLHMSTNTLVDVTSQSNALSEMEIDGQIPVKIKINKENDINSNRYGSHQMMDISNTNTTIPPCNALYIYIPDCPYAYRLFSDGYKSNTYLGTYSAINDDGKPIAIPVAVALASQTNKVYWRLNQRKYFIKYYNDQAFSSIMRANDATWFQIIPNNPLQISRRVGKRRKLYQVYADTSSCTDTFKVMHSYTGSAVYVNSCENV